MPNSVKRKPIVIFEGPLQKWAWVLIMEFQRYHNAKLHFLDKYKGTVEVLVRTFARMGLINEESVRWEKVQTINEKTGVNMEVNQVTLEKIGPAQNW
jgi:hypothetical protein